MFYDNIYEKHIRNMKEATKKLMVICGVIISVFAAMIFTSSKPVFAAGYTFTGRGDYCDHSEFLGLVAWDCNVTISDDTNLGNGIWMIAANVATDIAIIATYLVIGYVIYGGYRYTFSGGDPNKVASGKKTLTQAFTGLAITMLANVIVGAIRIALVGGSGNIGNCTTGVDACVTANELVENLINWVIRVIGVVSAAFLVYGGIQYITSAGDPTKLKRAKDTILYSLIGLAIVALATVITAFVSSTIRDANSETSININTTISKEVYDT